MSKWRLLLKPYLIIAISFPILYGLNAWILFIKFSIAPVNEDIIDLVVPLILPWIPVLIWLRPRIRLLKLKRDWRTTPDFGYMLVAAYGVSVCTLIGMLYLRTATGQLTPLRNISEITARTPTKYYSLTTCFPDKNNYAWEYNYSVSGKTGNQLNFDIYLACPLYGSPLSEDLSEPTLITPLRGNNKDSARSAPVSENPTSHIQLPDTNKLIIVLDGKRISKEKMLSIRPGDIASVNVLKKEAAKQYSDSAEAAILITSKQAQVFSYEATHQIPPIAWLCFHYHKQVSNRLGAEEKRRIEKDFSFSTRTEFLDSNLTHFTYLERIGVTKDHEAYLRAIHHANVKVTGGEPIVLIPKNKDFNQRNGNKLGWIFGSFGIALALWLIMIGIPKLDEKKVIAFNLKVTRKSNPENSASQMTIAVRND